MPVPTNLLVKETLAGSQMGLRDEEIPASVRSKLKVWIPSCLIDSWIDIMFLKPCHGLEAGAAAHESTASVIDLTVDDPPISWDGDVIDLTGDDNY